MKTIKANDPKVVENVVKALKSGGIIVFPTETCYGLGVDATNQKAVDKMLKYKARREGKPISVAVTDAKMASKYVEINEIAKNLYDNHLPGPLTVVSKSLGNLAGGLQSEYGTLGIRVPDYKLILDIVKKLGKPITATSANISYKPRPYSIEKLLKDTSAKQQQLIDLIIDAGTLPPNDVSTVVDTTLNTLNVIRQGQVEFEKKGHQVLSATTKSTEETINFGSTLILKYLNSLKDNAILIALGGELGTGKTQLTKGIAKQLGITQTVKSPTFILISEYNYKLDSLNGKLVHVDTWRLSNDKELQALQLEKYLTPGNVVVIEWADKFFNELKTLSSQKNVQTLIVRLSYISETQREIIVEESAKS